MEGHMYSGKSYRLKEEEFNYLISVPSMRKHLGMNGNSFYFVGNYEDLSDMLDRLKGFYNYYNEIKRMSVYRCSVDRSLEDFRKEVKQTA